MRTAIRAAAILLGGALATGCADAPTKPPERDASTPQLSYGEDPGCTPDMLICDDGNPPPPPIPPDDGYEEVYVESTSGYSDADAVLSARTYLPTCPSYAAANLYKVTLQVPNPNGDYVSVRISTSGTWSLIRELRAGLGRYNWPPGYWPAVDGSGVEVQISSADGNCVPIGDGWVLVYFGSTFQGVNARWPTKYRKTGGGSGGDGPGGSTCRTEYVVIEVDYGDGSGWQVWWEGYATVCE